MCACVDASLVLHLHPHPWTKLNASHAPFLFTFCGARSIGTTLIWAGSASPSRASFSRSLRELLFLFFFFRACGSVNVPPSILRHAAPSFLFSNI